MIYQAIRRPGYELLRVEGSSYDFPIHFHKRLCIGKVIFGEKIISINNKENKISKGKIFIIPPYIAHSCKAGRSNGYFVFSLNYNEINDFEILSEGASFLKIGWKEMRGIINNACGSVFIRNKIVNYLMQYLEGNYNCSIKIDELADKLGYSKYYILHLFKEKIGISLHQYIIQLRIKEAKRKNKNGKLLDIALESGFFDQSHFIKHFKKYEGVTPKKYYKSIVECG